LSDSHSIASGSRLISPKRCSTLWIIRSRMSPLSMPPLEAGTGVALQQKTVRLHNPLDALDVDRTS
jgi:hypothetical protein